MSTIDGMPFLDEFWENALITVFYKGGRAYLNVEYACEINGKDRLFDYQRKLDTNDYTVINFFKEGYNEFAKFYERYTKKLISYDEFKEKYVYLRIFPFPDYRNSQVIVEFEYNKDFGSRSKILATNRLWTLSGEDEINDMIHDLYKQACDAHPDVFGQDPD